VIVEGEYATQLRQHLHANGITRCPACGSGRGGLNAPGQLVLHELDPDPGKPPTPGIRVLPLICVDCGYVLMFSATKVADIPSPRELRGTAQEET